MTTPTTQPVSDIPTTPPVNPLNIAKKVQIGQLLEVIDDGDTTYRVRIDRDAMDAIAHQAYARSTTVTIVADCRHCAFTAEIDADDGDHSGIEFRVWRHERDFPGHVIGYRTDTVRWWE